VVLDRVQAPPSAERAIAIAAAGFQQRRKMLRRSLAAVFEDPVVSLQEAGIEPTARAEDLTPGDYVRLAS
jgi:16S rRNA (adenine1518-N6/adenine1519-N6)-dimethyltransferase